MWRRESFRKITILWLWMKSWWEQLSLIRVQKYCTFQYSWFQGRKQSNSAKNEHPSLGGSFSITVNGENKTLHTQSCDATGNTHHLWGILAKNVPLESNRGLNSHFHFREDTSVWDWILFRSHVYTWRSNLHVLILGGGTLGRWWDHEGRALTNETNALKGDPRELSKPFSAMWGHNKKTVN